MRGATGSVFSLRTANRRLHKITLMPVASSASLRYHSKSAGNIVIDDVMSKLVGLFRAFGKQPSNFHTAKQQVPCVCNDMGASKFKNSLSNAVKI